MQNKTCIFNFLVFAMKNDPQLFKCVGKDVYQYNIKIEIKQKNHGGGEGRGGGVKRWLQPFHQNILSMLDIISFMKIESGP